MPADITTAMESGSAAGAQTNAAQQGINALQQQTQTGANLANDYTTNAIGNLTNYSNLATNQANTNTANAVAGSNNSTINAVQNLQGIGSQYAGNYTPYMQTGQAASSQLHSLLSGDPATEETALSGTPGYQFTLQQGLKAAQNNATSRGLGVSGSALKGAATYATGLADSTYNSQVANNQAAANMGLTASNDQAGFEGSLGSAESQAFSTNGSNIGSYYNSLSQQLSNLYGNVGTTGANVLGNTGNNVLSAYANLGKDVAGQYTNIGNAQATADYATAQALQNTESEIIGAAGGAAGKMG